MEFAELKLKARILEPIPVDHDEGRLFMLRDPLRYSDKTLTVSTAAYWLVTVLDGQTTMKEIQDKFKLSFNAEITYEEMQGFIKLLDDAMFLDNEKFLSHKTKIINDFDKNTIRDAALAGDSYSDNREELEKEMDSYFEGTDNKNGASPFAIIAPHIDLRVGGSTFGAAYSAIKNSKAKTFLILAIGHLLADDFFACIDKDFKTPLGTSHINKDFLKNLETDFGESIYEQSFAHKVEHSAEFQILFLQKIFKDKMPEKKIVPILLSFPEDIDEIKGHPKFNMERLERFSSALQKGVNKLGDDVCVIAGIDLAHVGKRFGQAEGAPKALLEKIEQDDRRILELLMNRDKEGFISFMKEINPRNHVCGFPALYLLFDLLKDQKGTLLDYRQNVEGNNDSMVSFAAISF